MMRNTSRKIIRKRGFDYSQKGAYFITICTYGNVHRFGTVTKDGMILNDFGRIIETKWKWIPEHYPGVYLGEFMIMPNHMHGILVLNGRWRAEMVKGAEGDGEGAEGVREAAEGLPYGGREAAPSIPQIIHWFKTWTTNEFFRYMNSCFPGRKSGLLWHRSYHDRIIRNRDAFQRISAYIKNNPAAWAKHKLNDPSNDLTRGGR